MLLVIFVVFSLLLGYEIHWRRIEEKKKKEGYKNPYANENWYINSTKMREVKIPVSINIPTKKDEINYK